MTEREFVLKCRTCSLARDAVSCTLNVRGAAGDSFIDLSASLKGRECPYYLLRPAGLLRRIRQGLGL